MVLDYGWCYESGDMSNVADLTGSSSNEHKTWGPISEASVAGQCSGVGAEMGI